MELIVITDLPTCRWRTGPGPGGLVKCSSVKLRSPATGFPGKVCLTCYCADHDPVEPARPVVTIVRRTAPRPTCRHRGDPTGEVRECEACGGNVRIKLQACAVHEVCSVIRIIPGVHCCEACDDHEV